MASLVLALCFLLQGAPSQADTAGPTTFPGGLNVIKQSDKASVLLSTLQNAAKGTILYFPTDNCGISETNMGYLSTLAAANTDVTFIAVLRFLSAAGKEFNCGNRAAAYCTADAGISVNEVATYLPSGSLVTLVQDVNTEAQPAGNTCADGLSNCATYEQYCTDPTSQYYTFMEMGTECRLTCGFCVAAAAASFTPPSCGNNNCGAEWNQFSSTGSIQSAWDIKEQIVAYNAAGTRVSHVPSAQQTYPAKDQKTWDAAFKASLQIAITSAQSGVASSGSTPTPTMQAATPDPTPTPTQAPSPDATPTPTQGASSVSNVSSTNSPSPSPSPSSGNETTTASPSPSPGVGVASGAYKAFGFFEMTTAALTLALFLALVY